jgi:signal transduction histidine kinase
MRIAVDVADGRLTARIEDDGVGGADPTCGRGLSGLADRVEALGGVLRVSSPPGCGTHLSAELPLT